MDKRAGGDAGAPRDGAPGAGAPGDGGWYSRGYLPHLDTPHLLQFITYRLADSLPQEKLHQLKDELRGTPEGKRESARRQRIDQWLDAGMGCCALRHPGVARYVQCSFLHFHGDRYWLHAWCVMPNHVHVLIEPMMPLAAIVQGWKSFTSRWVLRNAKVLGLQVPEGGRLWMREYWDRYIRDERHYGQVVNYIHHNPVAAGLCDTPEAWPWSSAGVPGSANISGSAGVPAGMISIADEDVGAPGKGAIDPC
jgi:type I restriction enzyme R subunit/putative DNA methylase